MKMFFLRPGDRIRLLQDGLCDVTPERSVRTYITLPAGTILEVKRVKINKLEVNFKFKCLSGNDKLFVFHAAGEDISTWDIEIL